MKNPRSLLEQYDLHPKKKLGQNFLHDPNILEKIVAAAELGPEEIVIEVGAGTGALTEVLARYARHVFAIEIDERLRPILEEQLAPYDNVYLIFADFLQVDVLQLVGGRSFLVVANLPYYITSPTLRHLLVAHRRPRRLVLTVQYELAERIIAKPPEMNLLAVQVQFYGQPQLINRLKPSVFWPRPEVDSAVLRIDTYTEPAVQVPNADLFFQIARAGFGQNRKQLKNSLGSGLGISAAAAEQFLATAGIDSKRRAETLTLEEWGLLTRTIALKP